MENEKAISMIYNAKITPIPKPDRAIWKQKSILLKILNKNNNKLIPSRPNV